MPSDWLETLRKKQRRAVELRAELAQIEAELRHARAILSGRIEDEPPRLSRSLRGETGKKRPTIRQGSSVDWTRRVLEEAGEPLDISTIIDRIQRRGGPIVKKTTLVSNLSRYVKDGDTFERPTYGIYGLVEWRTKSLTPTVEFDQDWPSDEPPPPPFEG